MSAPPMTASMPAVSAAPSEPLGLMIDHNYRSGSGYPVPADGSNDEAEPETDAKDAEPPKDKLIKPRTDVNDKRQAPNDGKPRILVAEGRVRKPGPGRKPRACAECKKLKMKCEAMPGHASCRNCLRRNLECAIRHTASPPPSMRTASLPKPAADMPSKATGMPGYAEKFDAMRLEIRQLKESIDTLLHQGTVPSSNAAHAVRSGSLDVHLSASSPCTVTTTLLTREDNTHMAMTRENSPEPVPPVDYSNGAVTVDEPMGSLYEVTRLRNIRSNKIVRPPRDDHGDLDDFISKGVISISEAEKLYNIFHTTLNHYLWVGLEQTHPNFQSVRKSSKLLTATILTVTALHIPTSGETFDNCYREFLSLISSSMFSRYHSIDDVRGLCIAAFWLSDVSWKLSGHAIRIATELNIHQSFSRALEGDREHFLRARLWYMLYVCDHHFSIAYGRPPMIAESQQIREHEAFLASPFADALDQRICSQVHLMQILTRIYERFSVSERKPMTAAPPPAATTSSHTSSSSSSSSTFSSAMLSEADLSELRNFNLEIEQWRMRWYARQEPNPYIGTFPPKGIILYSYFAKLQLNSLAVRGVTLRSTGMGSTAEGSHPSPPHMSTERKEFANMGISAAVSILTFVLEQEDLRRALIGTPLYVHTMIAFASVFLLKMAAQWDSRGDFANAVGSGRGALSGGLGDGAIGGGLSIDMGYVSHLLRRMTELLKSSVTSDRHLLYHIAAGLEKMLEKLSASSRRTALHPSQLPSASTSSLSVGTTAASTSTAMPTKDHLASANASMQLQEHIISGAVDGQDSTSSYGLTESRTLVSGQDEPILTSAHYPAIPPMGSVVPLVAYEGRQPGWSGLPASLSDQDLISAEIPLINSNIIFEAFGSDSSSDVYNLLTSQFSY